MGCSYYDKIYYYSEVDFNTKFCRLIALVNNFLQSIRVVSNSCKGSLHRPVIKGIGLTITKNILVAKSCLVVSWKQKAHILKFEIQVENACIVTF